MNKRYIVRLTAEEREELHKMVSTGKAPAYQIRHAHILLKVDARWSPYEELVRGEGTTTVVRISSRLQIWSVNLAAMAGVRRSQRRPTAFTSWRSVFSGRVKL